MTADRSYPVEDVKMSRIPAAVITLCLACAISTAAQTTPAPAQASATPAAASSAALPKGTRIVGKLTTKLDTKKAESGQPVTIEVIKDVKSGDQVLLKKGSQIKGTIANVQAAKGKSASELDIVLDTVVPKDGQQFTNHFGIFALSAKVEKQPDDIYNSGGTQRLAASAGISGQTVAPHDTDITPQTTGIFGFQNVELHPLIKMTPPTASVSSSSGNFVLDKETQLVLESVGQ
jgi:hypothetical protein